MIFVGDDWAEDHHDVEVLDEAGRALARRRLGEGVAGIGALHALIAEHAAEPEEVVVGIETDRGLWVGSLVAAGYAVHAISPARGGSLSGAPRGVGRQVRRRRRPHVRPTWSAPTAISTGRSPATRPRRSRCWPGRTSG